MRTGTPWRDLPDRYGAWHTTRFKRWSESGWFWRLLQRRQAKKLVSADKGYDYSAVRIPIKKAKRIPRHSFFH